MSYVILRTDSADLHIRNIFLRVAENFGNTVALEKLNEFEKSVSLLSDNPYLGELPRYPAIRRRGYRVLILEKNLVFYTVNDEKKEITVCAVVDQRQDYLKILNGL